MSTETVVAIARQHFDRIQRELGDLRRLGLGFALVVFDLNDPDPSLGYLSTARRNDSAVAFAQFIRRHLAGQLEPLRPALDRRARA